MKSKKVLSVLLATAMIISTLAGCGGGADTQGTADSSQSAGTQEAAPGSDSQEGESAEGSSGSAAAGDLLSIEIYDVAANYQGVQSGWFDKVVKDRFNMELNIIAPQVAGDAVFQTRASSGNLGDILVLERADFADCVEAGLVKDISADISNYPNLMEYKDQIDTLNNGLPGNSGQTYGIPSEMTNTSPTSYTQDVIYSSPMLRWDLYSELGCPEIADLDGLLDVLEDMMEAHPTNESGDPAYPFSLWADWDGGDGMLGIANVVQLTTWYGEKIGRASCRERV